MLSGNFLEAAAFWFGVGYLAWMAVLSNRYRRLQESGFFQRQLIFAGILAVVYLIFGKPYVTLLIPMAFLVMYRVGDWLSRVYQGRALVLTNRYVLAHEESVSYNAADVVISLLVISGAALGIPFLFSFIR